jgi:hypothetical protein
MTVTDPWAELPSDSWLVRSKLDDLSGTFRWYLSGETVVKPETLADMCDWLGRCKYVADQQLFQVRDFWQHPVTFEQTRMGDCEDFALWSWRRLLELKIPASLYVGHLTATADPTVNHAWVVYRYRRDTWVFEPTAAGGDELPIRPLDEVRNDYWPCYRVGDDCQAIMCEGWINHAKLAEGLPITVAKRAA